MRSSTLLSEILGFLLLASPMNASCEAFNQVSQENSQEEQSTYLQTEESGDLKIPCPYDEKLQESSTLGEYVVKIFQGQDQSGCYEILWNGERLWSQTGHKFEIGGFSDTTRLPMGKDLDADGEPDLIVGEWTGGANCCFKFHLFRIGADFGDIDTISAGSSKLAAFENLDSDRMLEFKSSEWTFANWHTSFDFSPTVPVMLKYQGAKYRFAPTLMRSDPPSLDALQKSATTVHDLYARDPDLHEWWAAIWSEVLRLIYSGNAHAARRYLDLAWPKEREDKDALIEDFRKTLAGSPYYSDVVAMNNGESF